MTSADYQVVQQRATGAEAAGGGRASGSGPRRSIGQWTVNSNSDHFGSPNTSSAMVQGAGTDRRQRFTSIGSAPAGAGAVRTAAQSPPSAVLLPRAQPLAAAIGLTAAAPPASLPGVSHPQLPYYSVTSPLKSSSNSTNNTTLAASGHANNTRAPTVIIIHSPGRRRRPIPFPLPSG
ncbi:hypothetical protein STCU_11732 [Strigomonas culicis]|uniref:Uncharacterized protein n=1 Tax=Strigomonas culicis TaxID=28005 RepID=S9TFU6_9TRYP|nr:hypothetical protein STCU_11732 [Strigomonas culicis]|eukprot:EPY15834.1 hypothetical protein STCU_11732 [Strigomonas culicis]